MGDQDIHLLQRMRGTGIRRVAVSVYGGDQIYCNRVVPITQDALGTLPMEFFDSQSWQALETLPSYSASCSNENLRLLICSEGVIWVLRV